MPIVALALKWTIFIGAILACFIITGYLDANSTEAGQKRGTTHEANGIMQAAMDWLKTRNAWTWLKITVAGVVSVSLGVSILLAYGMWYATAALLMLDALYYAFVVARNYFLAGSV